MEGMNVKQTVVEQKTTEGINVQTPLKPKPYKDEWLEVMVKTFGKSEAISTSHPLLRVTGLNDGEAIAKSIFYIASLAARETRAEHKLALSVAKEAMYYLYSKGGIDFLSDPEEDAQKHKAELTDFKGAWDYYKDDPSVLAEAVALKGDRSWWEYHADAFQRRLEIEREREKRGLVRSTYLGEAPNTELADATANQ